MTEYENRVANKQCIACGKPVKLVINGVEWNSDGIPMVCDAQCSSVIIEREKSEIHS